MLQRSFDPIALRDGDINIWKVRLDCDAVTVDRSLRTLSQDEKQKADRFRFAKDRDRYIVARSSLRQILGDYLDLEPDVITFSYNEYGKPFLENGNPKFNLSHSEDMALIAITSSRDVGIDIEFIDNKLDIVTTAKGIFSQSDFRMLEKLPPSQRTRAFFRAWTLKEAWLKGLGKGFSEYSHHLPNSALMEDAEMLITLNDGGSDRVWSLSSLSIHPDYSAAVAVEGALGTIGYKQFSTAIEQNPSPNCENSILFA